MDFSFVSPQHLACQDVISRIGRAFVAAQVPGDHLSSSLTGLDMAQTPSHCFAQCYSFKVFYAADRSMCL